MKRALSFFDHDTDAHNNEKMQALIAVYGWEGYGRFWALNEKIARSTDAVLDLSAKVKMVSTAVSLGMALEDFKAFVMFLSDSNECGLVKNDGWKLTTARVQEAFEKAKKTRQEAMDRANRRWGNQPPEEPKNQSSHENRKSSHEKSRISPKNDAERKRDRQRDIPKDDSMSVSLLVSEERAHETKLEIDDEPFSADPPANGKEFIDNALKIAKLKQNPIDPSAMLESSDASLDDYLDHLVRDA